MAPGSKRLSYSNLLLSACFSILLCIAVFRHGDVGSQKARRAISIVPQVDVVNPADPTQKTAAIERSADSDILTCGGCQDTDCLAGSGNDSHAPVLVKRAYVNTWDPKKVTLTYNDGADTDAVRKGKKLLCMLDDGAGPASPFTDFDDEDLEIEGWTAQASVDTTFENFCPDLQPAFEQLGIYTANSPNNQFWRLVQNVITDEVEDPTLALYFNGFNAIDGFIMALSNSSPRDSYPEADQYPELEKWSDLAWLMWQRVCETQGRPLGGLNYVFRYNVINDNTRYIVRQALGSTQLGPWPGQEFSMDTDEGKAILGTPNGSGVAWFLINHVPQMGRKTVAKVNVFSTEKGLQLAFSIGNA